MVLPLVASGELQLSKYPVTMGPGGWKAGAGAGEEGGQGGRPISYWASAVVCNTVLQPAEHAWQASDALLFGGVWLSPE